MWWKNLLQAALELVYPPRRQCPLCAGHSPDESICHACRELLAGYAAEKFCPVCGSFMGPKQHRPQSTMLCQDCLAGSRPFDLARSVAPYEGPLRDAVHRLKYHGRTGLARPLGVLMVEAALREPAFERTQALVPVPLSPRREQQRGFNQALLLAREVGALLQAPVVEGAVVKIRETPAQTGLHRRERLQNLLHAFAVAEPGAVVGKIIAIIDDVFTTGSTVSIISQILRQSGAAGVMVLTLAGARKTGKW